MKLVQLVLLSLTAISLHAAEPITLKLWPNGAPELALRGEADCAVPVSHTCEAARFACKLHEAGAREALPMSVLACVG